MVIAEPELFNNSEFQKTCEMAQSKSKTARPGRHAPHVRGNTRRALDAPVIRLPISGYRHERLQAV